MFILKVVSFLLQSDQFLKLKKLPWLSVLNLEFLLNPIANELLSKMLVILFQVSEILVGCILSLR
jgi:hypothetical protein